MGFPKFIIAVSLSLNVALAAYLLFQADGGQPTSSTQISALSDNSANHISTRQCQVVSDAIQRKQDTLKQPVSYWQSPFDGNNRVVLSEKEKSISSLREELISELGEDVREHPLVKNYFYPLGDDFNFISSDAQIKIAKLKKRHSEQLAALANPGGHAHKNPGDLESAYFDDVREILGERDFFEFQLRESRLAQKMRMLSFNWSESEFREVFRIRLDKANKDDGFKVKTLAPSLISSESLYDSDIRSVLGDERYLEYLKAQDPIYKRMASLASSTKVSASDIHRAYKTYINYSEQIDEDLLSSEEIVDLRRRRDREITSMLGVNVSRILSPQFGSTQKRPLLLVR